jgi:hypothetical protein
MNFTVRSICGGVRATVDGLWLLLLLQLVRFDWSLLLSDSDCRLKQMARYPCLATAY